VCFQFYFRNTFLWNIEGTECWHWNITSPNRRILRLHHQFHFITATATAKLYDTKLQAICKVVGPMFDDIACKLLATYCTSSLISGSFVLLSNLCTRTAARFAWKWRKVESNTESRCSDLPYVLTLSDDQPHQFGANFRDQDTGFFLHLPWECRRSPKCWNFVSNWRD
jgi:hypothetical protein